MCSPEFILFSYHAKAAFFLILVIYFHILVLDGLSRNEVNIKSGRFFRVFLKRVLSRQCLCYKYKIEWQINHESIMYQFSSRTVLQIKRFYGKISEEVALSCAVEKLQDLQLDPVAGTSIQQYICERLPLKEGILPFNAWYPQKGHTYLNLKLKAAGLLKYV